MIFKRNTRGYTLLEMLIAILLTGVLAASGFEFYETMHGQTITQEQISYMQQSCRASLEEITKTLRMAGYKVGSHPAYQISGDSLWVFYNDAQPVDTVLYYLEPYTQDDLGAAYATYGSNVPFKLMKRFDSEQPAVFADYVRSISYVALNASTIQVSLRVQTSLPDDTYLPDNGFRSLVGIEQVILRNVAL